jgi:anti-sigma factor RsiW
MSHLGLWLSALVDGELDGIERDRVLNHVAGCDMCRKEANAMRALKRRLTALGETCAETKIVGRLIELAQVEQEPGARPDARAAWGPGDAFGPLARRRARLNRTGVKVLSGSAGTALIAIAVIAFLLGSGSDGPPVPKVTPSVDSYLLQHLRDAGQEPAGTRAVQGSPGRAGYQRYKAGPASPGGQFGLNLAHRAGVSGRLMSPLGTGSPGPTVSLSASPEPIASATASQGRVASATANPTASGSSQPGASTGSRTARHSAK